MRKSMVLRSESLEENKSKMEIPKYIVRNMKKTDIPQVLDLYKDMGWHTGTRSIHTWLEVDPFSFKVAVTDKEKVLGVCCAIQNHCDFYFVGYYIVRKNYRRMGIGMKVWNACMEHIGKGNAALNSVPDKIELYKHKGGFSVVEEDWVILENDTLKDMIHPENLSDIVPEGVVILPFSEKILHFVLDYDMDISGCDRGHAIKLSCKERETKTLVALKNGRCVGFGTIKRSVQNVRQISPLYADNAIIAETLLKRLLLSYPRKKGFSMVTFSNNKAANELVKKIGCPTTHRLPRMYKSKPDFTVPIYKVYAHFDVNCLYV